MFTQIFQHYKIMKLFLLTAIFCTFLNLQPKLYTALYKFFSDFRSLERDTYLITTFKYFK
ncbi:hypothetical protein EDC17_1004116 [Sphingobacterium alimentarium]|uniref:Uncharacterized protein n=1 Tax=Sphingobacterium alimentarium TaxID=797292 RepID=A0A4R3VZ40_9SPHI|nr:hypothetical protein EDC17_1004116 [Sphingobacterium alimentarium]